MAIRQIRGQAAGIGTHTLRLIEFLTVDLCWDGTTGTWTTTVRELNGNSDYGRAEEDALARTSKTIVSYIDVMKRCGVKPPSTAAQLKRIRETRA